MTPYTQIILDENKIYKFKIDNNDGVHVKIPQYAKIPLQVAFNDYALLDLEANTATLMGLNLNSINLNLMNEIIKLNDSKFNILNVSNKTIMIHITKVSEFFNSPYFNVYLHCFKNNHYINTLIDMRDYSKLF